MPLKILNQFLCKQSVFPPLLVGLSVGVALSLLLTPFVHESCFLDGSDADATAEELGRQTGGRTLQSEDYEPVIRLESKPKSEQRNGRSKAVYRTRFYSTELGIKEKIFAGIISDSKTVATMGVALNRTLAHHVDKMVLFTDVSGRDKVPKSLIPVVVGFVDERPLLKPFHVIHYIGEHFLNDFDFYFIARDTTYVRGPKLKRVAASISVGEDVYFGNRLGSDDLSLFCDLASGIMVSASIMRSMVKHLNWCIRNAVSEDGSDNIGRCVHHSHNQYCRKVIQGQTFTTSKIDETFNIDQILKAGSQDPNFNNSMTVSSVEHPETMYKLHLYFSLVELEETKAQISKLQGNIIDTNLYMPEEMRNLHWPIGTPPPSKPHDRFDIIRWDYFTQSHIYLQSDLTNAQELTRIDQMDIGELLNKSKDFIVEKYRGRLKFENFLFGFRRFDPTRGMDYILELQLVDTKTNENVRKRIKGVRPLSKVELIPVPYVTENTRIVLLLPVTLDRIEEALQFLDSFAKVCLEKQDNAMLAIMLLYGPRSVGRANDEKDVFGALKTSVNSLNNKYESDGAKISWSAVRIKGSETSDFAILDLLTKKFSSDTLMLMSRPGMEIRMDYLNRVRMNTIASWQVFFPIPFVEFHPAIIYKEKSRPPTIEIHKDYGHFDEHNADYYSFYNSDYQMARKQIKNEVPITRNENDMKNVKPLEPKRTILSMFLEMDTTHVLRSVEPSLRVGFHEILCQKEGKGPALYDDCLLSRAEGLASKAQLATLLEEQNVLV